MNSRTIGGWLGVLAATLAAIVVLRGGKTPLPAGPAPPPAVANAPTRSLEPIRIDGRFFVAGGGTFRPRFASALAVLVKSPEQRAAVLDEIQGLGFNGIRVFAGALEWAGQTPEAAVAALPTVIEEAARRNLYVYVTALTDSGKGYDVDAHLRRIAAIIGRHDNTLLEVANEIGHGTQSPRVNDAAALLALARRLVPAGTVWSLGAALGVDAVGPDGRYPTSGGTFDDAHLERGADPWRQVARLREIAGISAATGRPAMSGEPIGAAERSVPGKRTSESGLLLRDGSALPGIRTGLRVALGSRTARRAARAAAAARRRGIHRRLAGARHRGAAGLPGAGRRVIADRGVRPRPRRACLLVCLR